MTTTTFAQEPERRGHTRNINANQTLQAGLAKRYYSCRCDYAAADQVGFALDIFDDFRSPNQGYDWRTPRQIIYVHVERPNREAPVDYDLVALKFLVQL